MKAAAPANERLRQTSAPLSAASPDRPFPRSLARWLHKQAWKRWKGGGVPRFSASRFPFPCFAFDLDSSQPKAEEGNNF